MKHKLNANAIKMRGGQDGGGSISKGGASFLVQIHHAEHQSWQGSIQWLDTGEVIHFRSALEMTLLIDQAVQAGRVGEDDARQNQHQNQHQSRHNDERREWQAPMRAAK